MNWTNQRVLVTGAAGFIGSHLVERLARLGSNVRALVRYNSAGSWGWLDRSPVKGDVEVVLGDVRDRSSVKSAVKDIDVVFHLAALIGIPYSYLAPSSYVQTNIEGTLNVLQCSLDGDVRRVVHTSTSEVYGTALYVPIDENHPLQGQSPYSATKIGADKLAEAYHRSFGLPVATIRPFNTYGPRQSTRAVIPTVIAQALTAGTIRMGNLKPTRDLNFVADTVEGFLRVAQCPEAVGNTYNIGTGREISMGDLADKIVEILGLSCSIESEQSRMRPEASEVDRLCSDSTRARTDLGWQPVHSLEDGLTRTIEWMRENLAAYRPQIYAV